METRLSGQDVAFEAERDDDETAYAPIAYLADDRDAEPFARARGEGVRGELHERRAASRRSRASTRAAAASSRRAGCARRTPLTLHELAAEFKVSAERIRQIEAKALKKMRKALAAA